MTSKKQKKKTNWEAKNTAMQRLLIFKRIRKIAESDY
jgi:hypothetical protein